jgi:hypothetical protein
MVAGWAKRKPAVMAAERSSGNTTGLPVLIVPDG